MDSSFASRKVTTLTWGQQKAINTFPEQMNKTLEEEIKRDAFFLSFFSDHGQNELMNILLQSKSRSQFKQE